jgi:hypothetical protein
MKKKLFIPLCLLFTSTLFGQTFGLRYLHVDSLSVSTTAVDTTWELQWEEVTVVADTVDLYIRFGAPDYGSWTSRTWFRLNSGMSISIGPSPKLKKIEIKTVSGTGIVYFIGYKRERQY